MKKIKPKKTFKFSDNGATVKTYNADEEYEVSEACAAYAKKVAEAKVSEAKEVEKDNKDKAGAPENKNKGKSPKNKSR